MSPARKPPPPAVDGTLIAIDRWCPNCGAPAGKRCIDTRKRSRPAAPITHIARGWLDRPCRRCGAPPGERCRTPSGRDADPHTPRHFARRATSTSSAPARRPARPAARAIRAPVDKPRATVDVAAATVPAALPAARDPGALPAAGPAGNVVHGELVAAADELVTAFSATLVARPQTRRTYERACRRFTRWLGPHAGPEDLSAANVSRYHAHLVAGARSSATVKKDRAALNSFLRWLAKHEHVPAAQVRDALAVRLPRAQSAEQREIPNALSQGQYQRLVREAKARIADDTLAGTRDLAIVLVLGDAGLRCEELARLNRQDFLAARKSAQLRALNVRHGKGDRHPVRR